MLSGFSFSKARMVSLTALPKMMPMVMLGEMYFLSVVAVI